jgi:hypothetical protein
MNAKLQQAEAAANKTFEAIKNEAFATFEAKVKAATEAARFEYVNVLQAAETARTDTIAAARKDAKRNMPHPIDLAQVASVYSGVAGKCCCGCAGKHTTASAHRVWVGEDRGYEVSDDEVNDRTVKLIVGKIEAALNGEVEAADIDTNKTTHGKYFSATVGNRLYIAYLKS